MSSSKSVDILSRTPVDDIISRRAKLGETKLGRVRIAGRLSSIDDPIIVGFENRTKGFSLTFQGRIVDIFIENQKTKIVVERKQFYSKSYYIVYPEFCSLPTPEQLAFAIKHESEGCE